MKQPFTGGLLLYLAWIRCLSLLVPGGVRAEWRKHWASEIWYVYRDAIPAKHYFGRHYWRSHRTVATFCLGALDDARSFREVASSTTHIPYARSATQCLGILALAILCSGACFFFLPGERAVFNRSPYQDPGNLLLISREAFSESALPSISVEQYNAWRHRSQDLFSAFALYQPVNHGLTIGQHRTRMLSIASVTPNLFSLLGVSSTIAAESKTHLPSLVLSTSLWHSEFNSDPDLVGKIVNAGTRKVAIAAIIDDSLWTLPGKVDAWLVEPDESASALAPTSTGFVVARLSQRAGSEPLGERWHMSIEDHPGEPVFDPAGYRCVSLQSAAMRPFGIFLFTVVLAFFALPATTSLPLGEYRANAHQHSLRSRMRRWAFLYAKIALTLPIVFFISRDLTHLSSGAHPVYAQYIQIVASFCICLYGLRWALRDQRSRCPVCLCKLSHPARVGEASRNFLAWNGTELICADGHGLLHVPELPTCWFATQRWTYLDASWSGLFAKPT